jgi:hypothetical protein
VGTVARVEWTRQTGDDVEAAVGMLICSRHRNAVRVQPSQGDGGLDIFLPGEDGRKQREVYQVKSFCERLNSSRKRQIIRSLKEVTKTSLEEGWKITKWHLVMPLDLTDTELRWFHDELTKDCDFPCEMNGLLFCDTMAATYPNVVDYYLRDGKDRLQAATDKLTDLLSGRLDRHRNDPLVGRDVLPDLTALYGALNEHDPFYKYDFTVSDSPPPDEPPAREPDLVAVYAIRQESVWITFKIIARSLAALQERPIRVHLNVAIPAEDHELRQQFERFIDYGAPLSMPAGTLSGSVDLPGGLGGDLTGASLAVLSAPDADDGDPAELLLAIVAPDSDTVIASTTIKRTAVTVGQEGVRSVFVEKSRIFTLELRMQAGHLDGKMRLQTEYNLAGRRPAQFVDGLKVLAAWTAPNRIAFGSSFGPPNYGVVATVQTDRDRDAKKWAAVCEALARIQDHVSVLLRMPEEMDFDEAMRIRDVAKLVSGESITGTLSGDFTIAHQTDAPPVEREMGKLYEFITIKSIKFTLGDQTVTVGKQALFFRGRFARTEDEESELVPLTEGISVLYSGELEPGRVLMRPVPDVDKTVA